MALDTVFYGSILQAYSPLAVLVFGVLAFRPALAVAAIASSFVALLPVQLTSFIYLMVVADHAPSGTDVASFSSSTASAADAGRGWIVALGVVFQDLTRLLLAYAIVRAEWFFRSHHQVLFSSRFRILPVGIASGVGFASVLSLLSYGALLDGANSMTVEHGVSPPVNGQGVLYLLDACPQMPFLYFQALSAFFVNVSQVCWTALFAVAVAAVLGDFELPEGASSPIPESCRNPIPRPTTLRRSDGLFALATVIVLHCLSSFVSLANSGAYDMMSGEFAAGRGCIVSLPLQAIASVASVAMVVAVARLDVAKRIDFSDL